MRVLLIALAALAISAVPAQARSCSPFGVSAGYITSLEVKRTTCGAGAKVARAHYACRNENGRRGRCTRRVRRYICSEGKRFGTQQEFNAKVTCKRGRKRVVFFYQQNL